jgi:hypothetical protein
MGEGPKKGKGTEGTRAKSWGKLTGRLRACRFLALDILSSFLLVRAAFIFAKETITAQTQTRDFVVATCRCDAMLEIFWFRCFGGGKKLEPHKRNFSHSFKVVPSIH